MSIFNGNFFNTKKEYHSFIAESKALEALGIPVYSRSSLDNFFKKFPTEDLNTFFSNNASNAKDKLLGKNETLEILYFDEQDKQYKLQTNNDIFKTSGVDSPQVANSLNAFLNMVDSYYRSYTKNRDVGKVIHKIQNSYSGCITFRPTLNILQATGNFLVKLHINDSQASEERTLAMNGEPIVSQVPTTIGSATPYSISSDIGLGSYDKPTSMSSNSPKDAVAGKLALTYNRGLNRWESGTQQVMVRLMEDIDAPSINSPANIENADTIPISEFYDVNASSYIGAFETGKALVVNNEKGNPHMFGPNNIDGCEDSKKETITVVNRMNFSYKKNDIVIASLLGNEWIVTTPGSPSSKKNVGVKKWSFIKMIANSDAFCREYKTGATISYSAFERYFRIKFYHSQRLPNNLTTINIYKKDQDENKPRDYFDDDDLAEAIATPYSVDNVNLNSTKACVYVSTFDQVGEHMGGYGSKNLIGRTNVNFATMSAPLEQGFLYQSEIPNFWGCVFSQGYSASSRRKLQNTSSIKNTYYNFDKIIASGNGYFRNVTVEQNFALFTASNGLDGENILSNSDDTNYINYPDSGNRMFSNSRDNNLVHLPAEIGSNGSLSSAFGSPEESVGLFDLTDISFKKTMDYLKNNERYYWVTNQDSGNAYSLKPDSPSNIQFSPLQLEYAVQRYWDSLTSPLTQSDYNKLSSLASAVNIPKASLDQLILFGPETEHDAMRPNGGPGLFPTGEGGKERSNVVGVIAAVNNFSASDSISLQTNGYFGLPQKKTTAGNAGASFTFIPIAGGGVAFGFGGSSAFTQAIPQWGSIEEDAYYSFGTTALHTRIFDAWPREQTLYIPRFYAILHFNPGIPGLDYIKSVQSTFRNRIVDAISTPVDFRVPTDINYKIIDEGTVIDSGSSIWPANEWRVDTIRRGQLLTGGGFRYYRKYIGANDFTILSNPSEILDSGTFKLGKGVELGYDSNGQLEMVNPGFGFVPTDFWNRHNFNGTLYNGFLMNFGGSGKILIQDAKVYSKISYDPSPVEHTNGPVLLTPKSENGQAGQNKQGVVDTPKTTNITLTPNSTKSYDAFYYFHNDILHTLQYPQPFAPGYAQYVNLNIGVG